MKKSDLMWLAGLGIVLVALKQNWFGVQKPTVLLPAGPGVDEYGMPRENV